jgi:hypothetical protein
MRLFKFGTNLVFYTFIFNIIYTAYYGWNAEPINDTEAALDVICEYVFNIGIVCVLIPGVSVYKDNIERYEKRQEERKKGEAIPWHKHEESDRDSRQGHTEE